MTKLQLLNSYLTERLMVAVGEILEVVEGTVLEYEEETARTRKENELLKRRLREIGLAVEWTGSTRPVPLATSGTVSPAGQPQWTSSHRQASEPTFNQQDSADQNKGDPTTTTVNQGTADCPQWKGVFHPTGSVSTLTVTPDTAPLGAPAVTSLCVKKDSDPCLIEGLLDSCAVDRRAVDCGLGGIKPEPLDTCIDSGSASAEAGCPELETTATALTIYTVSDTSTDLESGDAEARYVAAHLGTDPSASANGSTQEAVVFRQIDSSGRLTGPDLDPSFITSQVKPRSSTGASKGHRSHPCPQCGKIFTHVSRLKIHLRIHTGEKPFVCALCGKRFNNDGTLRNHRRVHTELRLYDCPVCGMSFKDAYTCRKHQRVHNGMRPHVCAVCGKTFATSENLSKHLNTHEFHIG